jgi:hypothetical protein
MCVIEWIFFLLATDLRWLLESLSWHVWGILTKDEDAMSVSCFAMLCCLGQRRKWAVQAQLREYEGIEGEVHRYTNEASNEVGVVLEGFFFSRCEGAVGQEGLGSGPEYSDDLQIRRNDGVVQCR